LRHELHGDHREALDLAGPEYVDAVGMAQRRRELPFAEKPLTLLVITQPAAEKFQCDTSSAAGLFRFVDLTHPPLAERTHDDVSAKTLPGSKEKREVGWKSDRRRRHRACHAIGRP